MYLVFKQTHNQLSADFDGALRLASVLERMEDVIAYSKMSKDEIIVYKLHDTDRVTTVYTEQKITFQDGNVETENGEYHV